MFQFIINIIHFLNVIFHFTHKLIVIDQTFFYIMLLSVHLLLFALIGVYPFPPSIPLIINWQLIIMYFSHIQILIIIFINVLMTFYFMIPLLLMHLDFYLFPLIFILFFIIDHLIILMLAIYPTMIIHFAYSFYS